MTTPSLPAQGSTSWYPWAQFVDTAARRVEDARALGIYRPENYGALGDGTTDDLTALNQAAAAVPNGGTLVFRPGRTYRASDTVIVRNKRDVNVIGEGATIVGSGASDSARVLLLSNCYHGTVRGLTLRHATTGARRNDADGLSLVHCTDFNVTGINIGYVYSIGIRLGGCQRISIYGNTVNGSVADGIGAYCAARQPSNDVNMTAGSAVLTSASANFTDGDLGAIVQVNAGPSNAELNVPIVAVNSATSVTLSTTASVNVVNAYIRIARVSQNINIFGNHLPGTGDDAISSVGYRTCDSVPVGPNRNMNVYGNLITNAGARGVCFVGVWNGTIADNVVDGARQGSIYISTEPNVGGSWGTQDISVHDNTLIDSNLDYGNGDSNYAAISVDSVFSDYPVKNIDVHNNIIRTPRSYYLRAGGDGGQNNSLGTREVYFRENVCVGGNANNNGINLTKCSDIYIVGNRIDRARTNAIYADGTVGGVLLISGNSISAFDQAANGGQALAIASGATGLITNNNIINGVLTSTTTGGGNPPTSTPSATPPGGVTSGLALWLDASNITGVSDGATVATYPDGSGNGRNATQPTASAQPLYRSTGAGSRPFIDFNTTTSWMSGTLPALAQPMTIFMVIRDEAPTAGYRPYLDLAAVGAGGNRLIVHNNGGSTFAVNAGTGVTTGVTIPTNTWFLATVVVDGANSAFYLNGVGGALASSPGTTGVSTAAPGMIFNRYSDGTFQPGVDRAVDMIYNRVLTTTERQAVEADIKTKYGIA